MSVVAAEEKEGVGLIAGLKIEMAGDVNEGIVALKSLLHVGFGESFVEHGLAWEHALCRGRCIVADVSNYAMQLIGNGR